VSLSPGKCWWCGTAPADSAEHKFKRSDLVREFGKPPYYDQRTLLPTLGAGKHEVRGPNSGLFKFKPSMCTRCNNTRSQPFDRAWDTLTKHLVDNEEAVLATQSIDLRSVFGQAWRADALHVARYIVKHAICRLVQDLPGPIRLDRSLLEFLEGAAFPDGLQIAFDLDVGVVAMLKLTRSTPSPDPAAADAGFLYMTPVFVGLDERHHRHSPQGWMYYRWLAIHWGLGFDDHPNEFATPVVRLRPTDRLFGPQQREIFDLERELPTDSRLKIHRGGSAVDEAHAAGRQDIAERIAELEALRKSAIRHLLPRECAPPLRAPVAAPLAHVTLALLDRPDESFRRKHQAPSLRGARLLSRECDRHDRTPQMRELDPTTHRRAQRQRDATARPSSACSYREAAVVPTALSRPRPAVIEASGAATREELSHYQRRLPLGHSRCAVREGSHEQKEAVIRRSAN
jgi:hypothetical protein